MNLLSRGVKIGEICSKLCVSRLIIPYAGRKAYGLAEHFKGGWICIDDIGYYWIVENGRSTYLEEVNDPIRHNRKFSSDSMTYEIYVTQG
jgi:hypothetical protein